MKTSIKIEDPDGIVVQLQLHMTLGNMQKIVDALDLGLDRGWNSDVDALRTILEHSLKRCRNEIILAGEDHEVGA